MQTKEQMPKAIIIGAGIAGLASAIRLRNGGFEVSVFEQNTYPGGKLTAFTKNNYRFDAGPSLFTLPEKIDELFTLCGKKPEQYFNYTQLDEICRYFWEDGTQIQLPADKAALKNTITQNFGSNEAEKFMMYLNSAALKYRTLAPLFLEKSLHRVATWISKKALVGYLNIPKMGLLSTLHSLNKQTFEEPKLTQLFDRYATYNGSDPYQTPATMSIIPHLEYNIGAYFPKNGMHGITAALYQLAKDLGVIFHFNTKTEEILVENNMAIGILANGTTYKADVVISNMDISPTYRKLLPNVPPPEKTLNQPRSGSGLIFYWGIKRQFPELGLHNIFFSDNYKEEFEHQFKLKQIYHDPTVYLNISSKLKPDDAPPGCENWFILINAPANEGQDWENMIAKTRKNVIDKLSRILKTNIEDLIEVEEILDPIKIELKTSSGQGALYGTSSNNRMAAFLRHPNFSNKIENLYFAGGSVHPGGGIPLALSSAKIASEMIMGG